MWNGLTPVFVDIEEDTFNIDPSKIEALITPETTAIMPVHVYGNPCDVDGLQRIADTYGLKLIYDAAHAFGVRLNGESVLNHGNLSVLSFHATKTYTTFEGGAVICDDEKTKKRIDNLKNFGFTGETSVIAPGINGKMNEFQAAFGLLYLKYVDNYIKKRKEINGIYRERLKGIDGVRLLHDMLGVVHNYSYFPILIDEDKYGKSRDTVYDSLKKEGIYSRRYFYPLISQFPPYQELKSAEPGKLPIAEKVAEQVLCLPIYPELGEDEIASVIKTLNREI
jgi:dTDP-4-amino-4,6-dideoxygalactose transaminase